MSKYNKDSLLTLIYRSLDSDLSAAEEHELQQGLLHNPELMDEKNKITELRRMLAQKPGKSFSEGFADRVLVRLRDEQPEDESMFTSMIWSFRRILVIGTASILILAFNNILTGKEVSLESMLALPTISLENTIALNSFFEGE